MPQIWYGISGGAFYLCVNGRLCLDRNLHDKHPTSHLLLICIAAATAAAGRLASIQQLASFALNLPSPHTGLLPLLLLASITTTTTTTTAAAVTATFLPLP